MICIEAAKDLEIAGDDDMNGLLSDEEDDVDESDKEMGVDAEDGDEANNKSLQRLAAQVCCYFNQQGKKTAILSCCPLLNILFVH